MVDKNRFCTVTRAVAAQILDSDDPDVLSDRLPVHGRVTFHPMLRRGESVQSTGEDGAPLTIVLRPISARVSDGIIMHRGNVGVNLYAGGPDDNPSTTRWRAVFSGMQAGGDRFDLAPVVFDAVPGGTIDLTVVAPVTGNMEGTTRGPVGPQGPPGPRGPVGPDIGSEAVTRAVAAGKEAAGAADRASSAADRAEAAGGRSTASATRAEGSATAAARSAAAAEESRLSPGRQGPKGDPGDVSLGQLAAVEAMADLKVGLEVDGVPRAGRLKVTSDGSIELWTED